tara:strand:- start:1342 stop:1974 length:633 start_codon:yes stop_codon:yes gene_type:complete
MMLYPETEDQARMYFNLKFNSQIDLLREQKVPLKEEMLEKMKQQGAILVPMVMPAVKEYFKEYEVISTEEQIYEDIEGYEDKYKFKGYIDLVLKTPDNKYHIIDWKTCSWGWHARKKADKMLTYQLTFYKHFFAKKHNINPDDIETHFALLKRTAKKNNIEFFKVPTGKRKIENALNLLNNALYNISNKKHIKNRLSCGQCEFYKTVHCP